MKLPKLFIYTFLICFLWACSKNGSPTDPPLSSAKEISSFVLKASDNPSLTANIDGNIVLDSIKLVFPLGTSSAILNSLIPTIAHTGSSIVPADRAAQNFSNVVTYTVTAANGTQKNYFVKALIPATAPKDITSFKFTASNNPFLLNDIIGVISTDSIILRVPYGTTVNALVPTISISGSILSPAGGFPTDFTNPVVYRVTGTDGLTKNYGARVIVEPNYGTVYIPAATVNGNGRVYAIDAITGTMKWNYPASSGGLVSGNEFAGGMIFSGIGNKLVAIDTATKSVRWDYTTGGVIYSTPTLYTSSTLPNGSLYFNCDDGYFYSIDAATGLLRWRYQQGTISSGGNYSNPTIVNGIMYAGSMDGYIYAINAVTGALVWRKQNPMAPGTGFQSSPCVANGKLFIGDVFHNVIGMNASDGTFLWNFVANGLVFSSPTYEPFGGAIIVATSGGNIYSLDDDSGIQIWNYSTGAMIYGSPIIINERVYVGQNTSNSANLYCLDKYTGVLKWSYHNSDVLFSSPVVFDNTVYLGSYGSLIAVNATTGALKWKFMTLNPQEQMLASPCIVDRQGIVTLSGISGRVQ